MAVWHEVWIPTVVAGTLYVAVMISFLLLKFRKGQARSTDGTKGGGYASQESGAVAAEVSIDVDASISHKIDTGDEGGDKSNPEDSGALGRGNTQQEAAAAVGLPPPPDFTPVELRWDGLCVSFTNSKGQTTTVLQDECGEALAGEMLAIMGPSGAGKSTLVDALSARSLHGGSVRGTVTVNGRPMASAEFVKLRAFVPQEDHFLVSMTALETVQFHAALDLPPDMPRAHVAARAQEVLRVMGLSHHSHTLVGGMLPGGVPLRGLSGGQKRRLNIACRIVAAPPVVFLDEPTSGLDSTAALKVMSYMQSYAARQHTIIATLHQPRAAIWALLDKVLFVAFGRLMYLGPPDGVVPWFSGRLAFPYHPATDGLPCDWVMDLVSPDMALARKKAADSPGTSGDLSMARGGAGSGGGGGGSAHVNNEAMAVKVKARLESAAAEFTAGWRAKGVAKDQQQGGAGNLLTSTGGSPASPLSLEVTMQQQQQQEPPAATPSASAPPLPGLRDWLHQLRVLLWREGLMISRNPADAAGRMLTCMFTAVLEGLVFLALTDSGDAYQARLGFLFITLTFAVQLPFVNMGLILGDSWLLIREAAENMYSASACYAARLVINTTLNSCNAIVYGSAVYGLVGLRRGAGHLWTLNGILIFGHLIMCQIMAVGAVWMPTQDTAFMIAVSVVVLFLLLANFLIRWQEITWGWIAALRYVSPMYYGFGSLVENEFKDRTLSCPNTTPRNTLLLPGGAPPDLPCVTDGNVIVAWYTTYNLGTTYGVMAGWWVGLHLVTYAGMRWRIRQLRGN